MNCRLVLITAVATLALHAQGQPIEKRINTWDGRPKPLKGDYQMYGGTLSEAIPPTTKDRKVALMFTEPLAKELFDQIGPDVKMSCSDVAGYRERRRGDLMCTHDEAGYRCYFGLNVPTGKSTYGAIC